MMNEPEDSHLEAEYEDRNDDSDGLDDRNQDCYADGTPFEEVKEEEPYDGGGWPGDGSGTDDLADYNANEANDYWNE
jgi:hypothetical protein